MSVMAATHAALMEKRRCSLGTIKSADPHSMRLSNDAKVHPIYLKYLNKCRCDKGLKLDRIPLFAFI